ncbi:VOC family protein [Pseudonocardia phyllosphaerae]|uniref:VOC family protein n=1 Tax=Pseudonocardia phyllosphaerae TaxID=3390502 RepID=UPI00397E4B70
MPQISVVSVPVSDQERALRFYVDTLGFDLVTDASWGDGMRWVQVAPPGSTATLALVTWFDEMPAGSLRGLVVDVPDLDAAYGALRERGLDIDPPTEQPGGRFFFVADPDGNRLSFRLAGS